MDVRPAQGVPATVQPVPKTWAARIPKRNEPGSRKVDQVVLGGASRRDRRIAQASNRTHQGCVWESWKAIVGTEFPYDHNWKHCIEYPSRYGTSGGGNPRKAGRLDVIARQWRFTAQ